MFWPHMESRPGITASKDLGDEERPHHDAFVPGTGGRGPLLQPPIFSSVADRMQSRTARLPRGGNKNKYRGRNCTIFLPFWGQSLANFAKCGAKAGLNRLFDVDHICAALCDRGRVWAELGQSLAISADCGPNCARFRLGSANLVPFHRKFGQRYAMSAPLRPNSDGVCTGSAKVGVPGRTRSAHMRRGGRVLIAWSRRRCLPPPPPPAQRAATAAAARNPFVPR